MATRTGKIARLPLSLRDELCERLRDGEPGSVILPWINTHPKAVAILEKHFAGQLINDENLSQWRSGGYKDWESDQKHTERARRISELSARLAQAAGGNVAGGLLIQAAGAIQEAIEGIADLDVTSSEDGSKGPDLTKLVAALGTIRALELETVKTQIRQVEVKQKGEALGLEKKKFQRTTCELFLKWFDDQVAKDIASTEGPADGKLDALGKHLFGDAW
jgi:hypothetical protein